MCARNLQICYLHFDFLGEDIAKIKWRSQYEMDDRETIFRFLTRETDSMKGGDFLEWLKILVDVACSLMTYKAVRRQVLISCLLSVVLI